MFGAFSFATEAFAGASSPYSVFVGIGTVINYYSSLFVGPATVRNVPPVL